MMNPLFVFFFMGIQVQIIGTTIGVSENGGFTLPP